MVYLLQEQLTYLDHCLCKTILTYTVLHVVLYYHLSNSLLHSTLSNITKSRKFSGENVVFHIFS